MIDVNTLSTANSPALFPTFIVGSDDEGHWVAAETHGRAGGLFKSREAAIRFATAQTDAHQDCVRFVSTPVKLRF